LEIIELMLWSRYAHVEWFCKFFNSKSFRTRK